jgi:hypothetical protein
MKKGEVITFRGCEITCIKPEVFTVKHLLSKETIAVVHEEGAYKVARLLQVEYYANNLSVLMQEPK